MSGAMRWALRGADAGATLPTVAHAHEWRENVPDPPLTHAPTRLPTVRSVRWDDAGNVWEVEPGSERLPWAAMSQP